LWKDGEIKNENESLLGYGVFRAIIALIMEAVHTSEMSVYFYEAT
jgi:hypothetical protein